MHEPLYDAHCHLADARLAQEIQSIESALDSIHCQGSIVNGTSPRDWQQVLDYCQDNPRALPAIGLHPWQVTTAPGNWQQAFLHALDKGVRSIGEIGLDQWVEGHDIHKQQAAFQWQLKQAAERNLPVSIHCLRAIDPLMKALNSTPLPQRGVHVHALNVPVEAARKLIDQGSYFSFNTGQLKPNATHIYELIRAIPSDQILVETDSPDCLPTTDHRSFALSDPSLNHPANLRAAYHALATLRGETFERFCIQVEKNFRRYFHS
mgnify:CR=1 FL=1